MIEGVNFQPTQKKVSNAGSTILGTIAAAGLGAGGGYAAAHLIHDKALKASDEFIKSPNLIKKSILKALGKNSKTVSKAEMKEYIEEGIKQNKDYINQFKSIKVKWIAGSAAALVAVYLGCKALLPKKSDSNI